MRGTKGQNACHRWMKNNCSTVTLCQSYPGGISPRSSSKPFTVRTFNRWFGHRFSILHGANGQRLGGTVNFFACLPLFQGRGTHIWRVYGRATQPHDAYELPAYIHSLPFGKLTSRICLVLFIDNANNKSICRRVIRFVFRKTSYISIYFAIGDNFSTVSAGIRSEDRSR